MLSIHSYAWLEERTRMCVRAALREVGGGSEEEVKRKSSLSYHSYPLHSCFYSNRYRYYFPYTDRKLQILFDILAHAVREMSPLLHVFRSCHITLCKCPFRCEHPPPNFDISVICELLFVPALHTKFLWRLMYGKKNKQVGFTVCIVTELTQLYIHTCNHFDVLQAP